VSSIYIITHLSPLIGGLTLGLSYSRGIFNWKESEENYLDPIGDNSGIR
jgi:hypothetical protein